MKNQKNRSMKVYSQNGRNYKATPTIILKASGWKRWDLRSEIIFPSAVRMGSW